MTSEITVDQTCLMEDGSFVDASDALKAVASPVRIKILCVLGVGEACLQRLSKIVGTSPSNIAQHLAVLKDHKLLVSRRHSHKVLYRLADPRILNMIEIMCQLSSAANS